MFEHMANSKEAELKTRWSYRKIEHRLRLENVSNRRMGSIRINSLVVTEHSRLSIFNLNFLNKNDGKLDAFLNKNDEK